MAVTTDLTFLLIGFLVNCFTLTVFWRQRSHGVEAKKTVEKYATNLLLISMGDFVCHVLWTTTDASSFISFRFTQLVLSYISF
jgi:hypothetical protein